jgi:glycosyltransferase involved in cell wall biosynthesis
MQRTILTLVDHYLPGSKAGGPVRSIAHIVERLGDSYHFRIATRDRDFGDAAPYPGVRSGVWQSVGRAEAMYLPPSALGWRGIRKVLRGSGHDVLYLNSLFSARMTFLPLLLRRMRAVPRTPVVLAPRGELHSGALATGTWWGLLPQAFASALVTPRFMKKWLYIRLCRRLGLFSDVVWQASSEEEAEDVRRRVGGDARTVVASVLAGVHAPLPSAVEKQPGRLRAAFLSRIAPKKNLAGALRFLADVRARVQLDVYGPIDEASYWEECRRLIEALPPNVVVRYRGPVEHADVARIFGSHELMILPTWGENFGHVILEALLAGCPVLVSDQTPWRGLEAAGVGWDLPLSDPAAFARVVETVARMNAEEHGAWSRRAAEYGRRWAADEGGVERMRALFDQALAGTDAEAPPPRGEVSRRGGTLPERR